jgi:streptomycin 6-kinase
VTTELWKAARACAERWGLELEEPLLDGAALVVPAGDAVLKVNSEWHFEAEFEADALELYGGRGAVRLLARDAEQRALLLERCRPGTPAGDDVETVAALLPRLALEVHGPHPFRLLSDEAARWARELPQRYPPSDLLDAALAVFRSVDAEARWLVNQDLHGENVLRAEREPWLLIDPKPLVGEREIDGVGLLRNAAEPRRWVDALVELGYDRDRLWQWGFAHALAWDNEAEARTLYEIFSSGA